MGHTLPWNPFRVTASGEECHDDPPSTPHQEEKTSH